jgi:hypothetical protein
VVLFAFAVTLASSHAQGQSLWLPRDRDRSILVEALHPRLETIDEDFFTAAYFLDVRCSVSPGVFVVGELPYARFDGDFYYYTGSPHRSEFTPGNLYLGVEVCGTESPIFGEFGARLPATEEKKFGALLVGEGSDLGRVAFVTDAVPITAAFNLREVSASGIASRLRLGASLLVPTGSRLDTELLGLYALKMGYEGHAARLGIALSGSVLVTDDSGNLGQRSTNQMELHADFGHWRLRPGVELKLPLGIAASIVPVVLGVSVSAGL